MCHAFLVRSATDFVCSARRTLDKTEQSWQAFNDFVDRYKMPREKGDVFAILMSSNHSGTPELYATGSPSGCIKKCPDGMHSVSIGSGNKLIDPEIAHSHTPGFPLNPIEQVAAGHLHKCDIGIVYCQMLMNWARGSDAAELNKYNVGGVFNYVAQTDEWDFRQRPVVYIRYYIDQVKEEIRYWVTRVSFPSASEMLLFNDDAHGPRWTWHTSMHLNYVSYDHDPVTDPTTVPELRKVLEHEEQHTWTIIGPADLKAKPRGIAFVSEWYEGLNFWDWKTGKVGLDTKVLVEACAAGDGDKIKEIVAGYENGVFLHNPSHPAR